MKKLIKDFIKSYLKNENEDEILKEAEYRRKLESIIKLHKFSKTKFNGFKERCN